MRYVFTLLFSIAAQLSFAQCCPYLQPVQVVPVAPTATDQIRLVFQAVTPALGNRVNTNFVRAGNNLTFTGCYYSGFLAQPQVFTDTVRVGQLPPGTYTINFIGQISSAQQQCTEQMRNTSSRTFQVSGALAATPASSAEDWLVYPMPVNGYSLSFTLPPAETLGSMQVLDIAGRQCAASTAADLTHQGKQWQVALPLLPTGMYTLRLHLANGQSLTKRITVQ